jgi:hypothetical protein
MWRLKIAAALVVAVVAGVAAGSVVSAGTAAEQPSAGRDELPAGKIETGARVADPRGGRPWAVRIFDGDRSPRCIAVGRTDGQAFGPADASGAIHDTGAVASGSCADPSEEPLQLARASFADSAGSGPRSVLFGVADASVATVAVVAAAGRRPVRLDASRTFLVVSVGLQRAGSTTVEVRLSDGTLRTYQL